MTLTKSRLPAGRRLGATMGRVIPTVEDLVRRRANLYPAVAAKPSNPMLICDSCGYLCPAIDLKHVLTLRGRHGGHPDDDSPDEHATLCRGCQRRDTYREATPDEVESEFNAEKADLHEGGA